ncbi:MAG: ABC transporter permease [Bacillota bacterium]
MDTVKTRWYFLLLMLRLSGARLGAFLRQLGRHPTALLGLVVLAVYLCAALFAPWIAPHDPRQGDIAYRLEPPGTPGFVLGTDHVGRDMLSRLIYGARVSLLVGFVSVIISMVLGTVLGAVAGYFRGWFDQVLSRFSELLMAFPFLIFAIGVMAIMGPGFVNLIGALTFKSWVEFFRLARGEVISEKSREYVEASRASGLSHARVILSEILPNIIHSVIVLATLRLGHLIITEASLSFLGIGVQPGVPAWGSMVNDGREFIFVAWWTSTLPGLVLIVLVLAINLFGEGLRDILDPRLKLD